MQQNNANQWPIGLTPTANCASGDELTTYATFQEIIESLPAASIEVPLATASQPPAELHTDQGQGPATAKRGDQQNPKPIPDKSESLARHRERQKRYRERQRNEEADKKKQLTATASEIQSTRAEQDNLLAQNTVLSKTIHYCSSAIQAAQTLVSSTFGRARSQCRSTVEGLAWLGLQFYSPSDAQLHAFIDSKSLEEMESLSVNIVSRSFELFTRYDAEPEAREDIEAQLERIRSLRFRTFAHLARTRPEAVVEMARRRIMPTGPDGAPNPKLEMAVAALNLTPEQLDSFKQQWILYLQKTESTRQEVRSLISFLTSSNTKDNILSFCSMQAAGLFTNRLQAVQELELHPSNEAEAILLLSSWLTTDLTTAQKATLMRFSTPYYPDPIQLGRILFREDSGNTIQSRRVENVYNELQSF